MAIDDALDYLTGLIPEFHSALVVVTDTYQARAAEIAAQYLRFMAISGIGAVSSRIWGEIRQFMFLNDAGERRSSSIAGADH